MDNRELMLFDFSRSELLKIINFTSHRSFLEASTVTNWTVRKDLPLRFKALKRGGRTKYTGFELIEIAFLQAATEMGIPISGSIELLEFVDPRIRFLADGGIPDKKEFLFIEKEKEGRKGYFSTLEDMNNSGCSFGIFVDVDWFFAITVKTMRKVLEKRNKGFNKKDILNREDLKDLYIEATTGLSLMKERLENRKPNKEEKRKIEELKKMKIIATTNLHLSSYEGVILND